MRGILRGLPVGVVCAALDIVDRLAIELEWNTKLDKRLYLALPGDDAFGGGGDRPQVAGANSGESQRRPGPSRRRRAVRQGSA